MSMTEEDALKLLDIKKGSSIEDINKAYKRAAMKTHPDKGGTPESFVMLTKAKDKLVSIAVLNGKPVDEVEVSERKDVKNVIVLDDAFFLMNHEEEFRAWRKPNVKVMNRLSIANHNQYTEMVIDFCYSGNGGSYQAIEDYFRNVVGITSPYKMNERIIALKRMIQQFREYMDGKRA